MPAVTQGPTAKLDLPLLQLVSDGVLHETSSVPVIIRCQRDALATITADITEQGGRVRRTVDAMGLISAWVPISVLSVLDRTGSVRAVELELGFSIA